MTALYPADNPELVKRLWHLTNRLRDRGMIPERISTELLEVSAALILIRRACSSANSQFANQAASHWERLRDLHPTEISTYFASRVLGWLNSAAIPSDVRCIELILQVNSLVHADPELFIFARESIDFWDLDSRDGRLRLATELDGYLQFASSKSAQLGQYLTPPALIDFITTLAKPRIGDTVYDPFCGMGGLLASAARDLDGLHRENYGTESDTTRIIGRDLLPGLALVAAARTVLSGFSNPLIVVGDTLRDPHEILAKASCIISNPPFGNRREYTFEGALGLPSKSVEVLAIQHIIASLAPGGRAFIVVPENFLFSAGATSRLRELLLTKYCVEAVIGIPSGAFKPYTSIKTNLLVVTNRAPKQNVLFISDELTRRILSDGANRTHRISVLTSLLAIRALDEPIPTDSLCDHLFYLHSDLSSSHTIDTERNLALLSETADVLQLVSLLGTTDPALLELLDRCRKELDPTEAFIPSAWELPITQISDRSYELVVRPPTESELGRFLDELTAAAPDAQLRNLSDVAEVFGGIRYRTEFLSDIPNPPQTLPLIRVQDVTLAAKKESALPTLSKPRKYLLPIAVESLKRNIHLQEGDILLTASGTVGAIGIIGSAAEGCVASNGLIVIRPKHDFNRVYLLRLLQSIPYQSWFTGHASGSTIRHLSIQQVRRLPIALLPIDKSERVSTFLSGGEDAATILHVINDLQNLNAPIHILNERHFRELVAPVNWQSVESEKWWGLLSQWLNKLEQVEPNDSSDPYMSWLRTLARELLEAKSLPDATDSFALFQSWRNKLAHSYNVPSKTFPARQLTLWSSLSRQHADQLTRAFFEACSAQTMKLLADIDVDASPNPSVVTAGTASEIQLTVRNRGALPLRKLQFETSPVSSTSATSWLKPGDAHSWNVHLAPMSPGRQSIYISWTGERMDGSPADGRVEVAVEAIQQISEQTFDYSFSQNPYVCGAPIDSTEMFYGRSDTINKLRRSLRNTGPSTVIILQGNRRAGKTSICKQLLLPQPDLLPGWIKAYWSLQAAPGHESLPGLPTREIFYNIARELYLALYAAQIPIQIIGLDESLDPVSSRIEIRKQLDRLRSIFTDENAFRLVDSQLEETCSAIGEKRLLLILDEFEKLQEGIDNGITSPQLPENIRDLFQRYNKLSGILTGSKRIKKLREEYWSILYGIGIRVNVGALDEPAARDLIQKPSEGMLVFSPSATEKIMSLCACQPFLIQTLCHYVFEECASASTQNVTAAIVDSAVSELLEENEHFKALWDFISNDRRRYLAYLVVNLSDGADVITSSFLAQRLEADGINPASLDDDLDELRELDVLHMRPFNQGNSYYIGIPLFALWMRKHKDFSICRDKALAE